MTIDSRGLRIISEIVSDKTNIKLLLVTFNKLHSIHNLQHNPSLILSFRLLISDKREGVITEQFRSQGFMPGLRWFGISERLLPYLLL